MSEEEPKLRVNKEEIAKLVKKYKKIRSIIRLLLHR